MYRFLQATLTTTMAHLYTLAFAGCYVGSLYISKNARLSFSKTKVDTAGFERSKTQNERWRDDPDVIRARMTAVSIATVFACLVFGALLWYLVDGNELDIPSQKKQYAVLISTIYRLGFGLPTGANALVLAHLVTPTLFLGPLYAYYLDEWLPFQRNWSHRYFVSKFTSLQGIRNYLIGPVTEEIVFRSCVLAVYHLSGASTTKMIFLAPLSFGLAHVHHAWDTYNRFGRTSSALKRAVLMSVFQLGYTSLFGFHCSYLFLRTSSIYAPISSHIFCNIMGLPQIGAEIQQFPTRKFQIILVYILGVVGYVYTLRNWTLAPNSIYWDGVGY